MDDIDELLDDLRNATVSSKSNKNHLSIKSDAVDNDVDNDDLQSVQELNNLLDILSNEKRMNQLNSSRQSLKHSSQNAQSQVSSSDTKVNVDSIKMSASLAAKELDEILNSVSAYKVEHEKETQKIKFNLNRQNSKNNRNLCASCGELIDGQVITALGSLWHPEHFCCIHCDQVIGTSIFYEKDHQPYCERDYLELFSPKCGNCCQPILDKMLTALNKTWHPECFLCSSCSKLLSDESFLEKNNNAFCRDCYMNKLAPKCKKCLNPIVDNFISAMSAHWHPHCFVCCACATPFLNNKFFEYNALPYCEQHYHEKRGSLCAACRQAINGRCITAMQKKFHPEHFICSFCQKQLNMGTFKEMNEKPYCHSCYFRLFPF